MVDSPVDLSPYHLLICTPIATGRPDDTYCVSLDNTKQLIRQHGGKVENFKTKCISDIAFARSKLFGAFLRHKEATHMLMIDDDMGWTPEDVVWMLLLKRDFIAAVGTKKVYPIEFAYSLFGDDGKQQFLCHELETNVCEMPFVGGAFVMLSRACVERMAAAYKDLIYHTPDGTEEYAIFDPIILNKRYLSEDYSFCHRWRKLGGKIYVKMDCTLTHTGQHTFTGNFYQHLMKTEPSFADVKKTQ